MVTLNDFITHPLTAASGVFAALAAGFQIGTVEAIATVIWSQAATLFTVLSISAFTVVPNVDLGPFEPLAEFLTIAALLAGVLYVGKLANQLYTNFKAKL